MITSSAPIARCLVIGEDDRLRVLLDHGTHAQLVTIAAGGAAKPIAVGTLTQLAARLGRALRQDERVLDALAAPAQVRVTLEDRGFTLGRRPEMPADPVTHFSVPAVEDENLAYAVESPEWVAIRLPGPARALVIDEIGRAGIVIGESTLDEILEPEHPIARAIPPQLWPVHLVGALDGEVFRVFDARGPRLDPLSYRDRLRALGPILAACARSRIDVAQTTVDAATKRAWLDALRAGELWHIRMRRIDASLDTAQELVYGVIR